MKLNELKKAAAKAQQDLQLAEGKATELQRQAKPPKPRRNRPGSSISGLGKRPKKPRN